MFCFTALTLKILDSLKTLDPSRPPVPEEILESGLRIEKPTPPSLCCLRSLPNNRWCFQHLVPLKSVKTSDYERSCGKTLQPWLGGRTGKESEVRAFRSDLAATRSQKRLRLRQQRFRGSRVWPRPRCGWWSILQLFEGILWFMDRSSWRQLVTGCVPEDATKSLPVLHIILSLRFYCCIIGFLSVCLRLFHF